MRMKLLCEQGFYGLLLMHMHFHLSGDNATAWSDGKENIFFHPQFLDAITDSELEYVMVHLLLHVILDHFSRREGKVAKLFDEAADIVVNSNILRSYGGDEHSICLNPCGGVQPHQLPDGEEGYQYTSEEVYDALRKEQEDSGEGSDDKKQGDTCEQGAAGRENACDQEGAGRWDVHPKQQTEDTAQEQICRLMWQERMLQAAESMKAREAAGLQSGIKVCGTVPLCVERYLKKLKKPQVDWRIILAEFVQEEIHDYSFCPPDRRFYFSCRTIMRKKKRKMLRRSCL